MSKQIARAPDGSWYWVFILLLGIALEAVALYYQYVLDYAPCVLCIHVRMLVFAAILLSLAMLWGRRWRAVSVAGHIGATVLFVWLTERSWQLLATERGWSLGSCDMRSGLPDWLALEDWIPFLFRIHEPCGYTPVMPLGVTMAEALLVISALLSLVAVTLSFVTIKRAVRG